MTQSQDRTQFIGGSDIAVILGVSPFKTAVQLWLEKRGETQEEITPEQEERFWFGHENEKTIVKRLEFQGHTFTKRNERYTDSEHPIFACEIDAEDETYNWEMKTTAHDFQKLWGEEGTDEIPMYYAAQVMWGLMITGRQTCKVARLLGGSNLKVYQVHKDEELTKILREKALEFWSYVQSGEHPPIQTKEDIKLLYPKDDGTAKEASVEEVASLRKLQRLKAVAARLDKKIKAQSPLVEGIFQAASSLVDMHGNLLATYKLTKRKGYVVNDCEYRQLNIKKQTA